MIPFISRNISLTNIRRHYDMPEKYRNSLYLANASLFDSVNWHLHYSYEKCFMSLVEMWRNRCGINEIEAINKVSDVLLAMDQCNSLIDIRFPIKRDNGLHEVIRGYRAQHGLFAGDTVCLGGMKIADSITRDHTKGSSVLSTYKHNCLGINLAGAFGGIRIDPSHFSENELKLILEGYLKEAQTRGYCDGKNDLVEVNIKIPTLPFKKYCIADILLKSSGATNNNLKIMDGLEDCDKITSQGIFFAIDYFVENDKLMKQLELDKGLKNKRFIMQGLGKAESYLAKYLVKAGAICVGVTENKCYVYDGDGIDLDLLIQQKNIDGTIRNHKLATISDDNEIFSKESDIVVLASNYKPIGSHAVDKLSAKIIVEAVECPVMTIAHRILVGKKKLLVPDIYVCAVSCILSYLEYLYKNKDKQIRSSNNFYGNILESLLSSTSVRQVVSSNTVQKIKACDMEEDIITFAIESIMTETAREILDVAQEYGLGMDLKTAAYICSVKNIFKSILKRI